MGASRNTQSSSSLTTTSATEVISASASKEAGELHKPVKPTGGEDLPDTGYLRTLSTWDVIFVGCGAIIGAGIYTVSGQVSSVYAGPAVSISFLLAAISCFLTALCYSELSGLIMSSGSAYSFTAASLGRLPAWIIGWNLILEYLFGSSIVAVSWSGYLISCLEDFGIKFPHIISAAPVAYDSVQNKWEWTGSIVNLPAAAIMIASMLLQVWGVRQSLRVNTIVVVLKTLVLLLFIVTCAPVVNTDNYSPFIPEPVDDKFGHFGFTGVLVGSSIVMFAFIGFDAVSTTVNETKNPRKTIPIATLTSLAIASILYVTVSLVMTGVAHYTTLNVPDPIAVALNAAGEQYRWLRPLIKIGALLGLTSVILVQTMGQARILSVMANDGNLPAAFGRLHKKFHTPYVSAIAAGIFGAFLSGFLPMTFLGGMVSIGTLSAFLAVAISVIALRRRAPTTYRSFRVPFSPFVPLLSILVTSAQMSILPVETWVRFAVWIAIGLIVFLFYGRKYGRTDLLLEDGQQYNGLKPRNWMKLEREKEEREEQFRLARYSLPKRKGLVDEPHPYFSLSHPNNKVPIKVEDVSAASLAAKHPIAEEPESVDTYTSGALFASTVKGNKKDHQSLLPASQSNSLTSSGSYAYDMSAIDAYYTETSVVESSITLKESDNSSIKSTQDLQVESASQNVGSDSQSIQEILLSPVDPSIELTLVQRSMPNGADVHVLPDPLDIIVSPHDTLPELHVIPAINSNLNKSMQADKSPSSIVAPSNDVAAFYEPLVEPSQIGVSLPASEPLFVQDPAMTREPSEEAIQTGLDPFDQLESQEKHLKPVMEVAGNTTKAPQLTMLDDPSSALIDDVAEAIVTDFVVAEASRSSSASHQPSYSPILVPATPLVPQSPVFTHTPVETEPEAHLSPFSQAEGVPLVAMSPSEVPKEASPNLHVDFAPSPALFTSTFPSAPAPTSPIPFEPVLNDESASATPEDRELQPRSELDSTNAGNVVSTLGISRPDRTLAGPVEAASATTTTPPNVSVPELLQYPFVDPFASLPNTTSSMPGSPPVPSRAPPKLPANIAPLPVPAATNAAPPIHQTTIIPALESVRKKSIAPNDVTIVTKKTSFGEANAPAMQVLQQSAEETAIIAANNAPVVLDPSWENPLDDPFA